MSERKHILYVEDDISLQYVTQDNLERKGYKITHSATAENAIQYFDTSRFDLVILDVMLPDGNGFEVASYMRATNRDVPILFLSARTLKEDRIKGLMIGGDDYICKPFSIEELILKIEVFLRRSNGTNKLKEDGLIKLGDYVFDHSNYKLIYGQQEIKLSPKESDLLFFLCKNLNQLISRDEIFKNVWKNEAFFLSRSLDQFISRLRKHLRNDQNLCLKTVHGIGFTLELKNKQLSP